MSRRYTCCQRAKGAGNRRARGAGALCSREQLVRFLQQYAQSVPHCTSFPENGNKKTLTLAGARGKQSSRYHPGLLTPHGINLDECCEHLLSNTLVYNGTNRLSLLPEIGFQPAT